MAARQETRPRDHDVDVLSPELVLVDSALAASARARLPDVAHLALRATPPASPTGAVGERLAAPASLVYADGASREPQKSRSKRALVGVATVTVLVLLLFDVRVHVERTPAGAERRGAPDVSTPPAQSDIFANGRAPTTDAVTGQVRRFAWAPSPGAEAYVVELFLGANRVFSASTPRPAVTIPERWTHGGEERSLGPGEYRWYVWPVVDGRRASTAVVQATLAVP